MKMTLPMKETGKTRLFFRICLLSTASCSRNIAAHEDHMDKE
jgi:hypothetical protein